MLCRIFLSIGFIVTILPLMGQISTINGTVSEQGKNIPIPYVNIWITGLPYGTSTNHDGEFEIKFPPSLDINKHTISFSSIGFYSKKISASVLVNTMAKIELQSSVTNLSELVIHTERAKKKNAATARRLVQKALNQISKNYPKKPYLLNTFYRHYCSENANYVRLIEAAIDVYSPKNDFKLEKIPDDRLAFRVAQLRRSFDFTENAKLFHPPISLNYLWSNDLTDFEYHNPFSKNLGDFNFNIIDTTNFDQESVYVLDFSQAANNYLAAQSRYHGKLYITKNTLAFIRTEVTETKEKHDPTDSVHSVIKKISIYKPFQNKYYLDRLINDVDVFYARLDSNRTVLDTLRHKSHIEMIANNIQQQESLAFAGKEPQKMDLREIKYDSIFWNHYTVLKATVLEKQIIADLSEKISLQQQFESFNTIDGGGMSITDSDPFKELMADHSGTPLYLVLWSNWGHLNHLDLRPINYFRRMLKKERVKLLLVAVEHNQDQWLDNRNYFGLNLPHIEHARLDLGFDSEVAKSYFNNFFPYFLSVSSDGNTIFRNPPLPAKEEVKPFLKALIRDNLIAVPIAKE